MKIDIHTHTKKTKQGDSVNRNVTPERFAEIISETDIDIVAITNHNHFDISQYEDIIDKVEGSCQVWPGIELDIIEDDRRGHLLVVVNPKNATTFSEKVEELLDGTNEDEFSISINDTIANFDQFDTIYVPHYYSKKPNLIDEDIMKLVDGVANTNRVIKEATNSISAGIYVSHGHKSIYGSDVQDWSKYIELAKDLPDLRLPVESYEQFCLLLDKDETTINTVLDAKRHEIIEVKPFEQDESISIGIYNDINVLFGSKGTGKSEILKAISKYYNANGITATVYESSVENLNDFYDIKGKSLSLTLDELSLESCAEEIAFIKNVNDESVTLISNYSRYFSSEILNKRARAIKINGYEKKDTNEVDKKLEDMITVKTKFDEFIHFLNENQTLKETVGLELLQSLLSLIEQFYSLIMEQQSIRFTEAKSQWMFNSLINIFETEISRKTGTPTKPSTTGFLKYARKRISIEKSVTKLIESIESPIPEKTESVGNLDEKGNLDFRTEFIIQTGDIANGKLDTLKNINKTPQKEFVKQIYLIKDSIYKNDLFVKIAELKQINEVDKVIDIDDLVMFQRYFSINGSPYKPSNGESSMVLLHKELLADKEIYLLDEPEKSLGNDYISDVIVPLLKERARMGKKIILATHDANIAVRTLPYNTIYRKHDMDTYSTYIGNPFSNNLVKVGESEVKIDWKEISMKTLEGGKNAFGERGKIYGN